MIKEMLGQFAMDIPNVDYWVFILSTKCTLCLTAGKLKASWGISSKADFLVDKTFVHYALCFLWTYPMLIMYHVLRMNTKDILISLQFI